LGYMVDGVDEKPGQEPGGLCQGAVVVGIAGKALFGLPEEALEETFGEHFGAGVRLLLLAGEELRRAIAERDSQGDVSMAQSCGDNTGDIVLEHGSVVQVPLCSAEALSALAKTVREDLDKDLATFSGRAGVRAELNCPEGASGASIVISGEPEEVRAARPELGALVEYYSRHHGLGFAGTAGTASETVEVEGLVMQSLPARNRRRRRAPEEEAAGDGRGRGRARGEGGSAGEDGEAECQDLQLPESKEIRQYEYMDHTADVILHSWGVTMKEALAQVCVAFFSYLTDPDKVEMTRMAEVEAKGHDILDMVYHLLDEFLFVYGSEYLICRRVEILELDEDNYRIRARGWGERFDLSRHTQGTEIKAITMHQMKILNAETLTSEDGTIPRKQSGMEGGALKEGFPFECYVLVDI